jgi:gephyrin
VIFDSNRPSLHAALRAHGYDVIDLGIVPDDEESTTNALLKACREADVVITTGGTSMGEGDLLKPVIERNLNGTIHFGRVAMKPGKPTTFATIPAESSHSSETQAENDTLVFALPGNPASALVTFHLFVLPALRKMSGYPEKRFHLPKVRAKIMSSMHLDPRPEFHRVWVESMDDPPYLVAKSTGGQRSSRTLSLANANALICLPSSKDREEKHLRAGDVVEAILIGPLG